MRRLSLLRHAKSSWDNPQHTDHERQLTKRGTKAATRIGRYIAENNLTPDVILCSDAARTRATLALVLASLDQPGPETTITNKLYLASPGAILRTIRQVAGDAHHIMVIGHNPGLHGLVLSLPATGPPDALTQIATKYPTAALAHITFDVESWNDMTEATGTLERYIAPRALAE